ncbi:MAG: peptidoglycan DD-metalloendopeptidase family protein [Bacteroidota bacterium]
MSTCKLLLVITLLSAPGLHLIQAQSTSREISKKEKELAKLRSEIEAFELRLKESEKRERSTLEHLDNLERQANLIRHLIKKLKEQEQQITNDIHDAKSSIGELEQQLESLRSHYAKYVRSVYKYGRVYDIELLFSSNSINQLYIRIAYLKRFSEQRAKDLQTVLQKKADLEQQNDRLQQSLDHERRLLAEKTSEESSLKRKASQRQKTLAEIRKDKRVYQQELKRKNEAVREIEKLIAELIEKDRLRKEREAAAARERGRLAVEPTRPPKPEPEAAESFAAQKGRIRWPVSSGTISSRFGNQVHPVLKTVTQNTGVDIQVRSGSDVLAVADGEVSILSFIPGFGNVIILNHYNGFRTVYAHLSEITVVEAQKVKAGEAIAKSGESVQGPVLHFEIWKEREKQNPELWLTKPR